MTSVTVTDVKQFLIHNAFLLARSLLWFTAALTVFSACWLNGIELYWYWVVAVMLPWPYASYLLTGWISRPLQNNKATSRTQSRLLITCDTMIISVLLAIAGIPLFVSLATLILLSVSSISAHGFRFMCLQTLLFSGLIFLTHTLLPDATINPPLPVATHIIIAAGMLIYLLFHSWLSSVKVRSINRLQQQAQQQKQQYAQLVNNMTSYLPPRVHESLSTGQPHTSLQPRRKRLTVFFSDIEGFTDITDEMDPEALTGLLNHYLDEMSRIALHFGGTIDKFIGDSLMVYFGDHRPQGDRRDALAAVSMAIAMRKHMKVLRQHWRSKGIRKPLNIRMGISTGFCTVGNFGTASRMDYTIMGGNVNLASRLESRAGTNQILIAEETWSLVKDVILCRAEGEVQVKGIPRPVPVYEVMDFRRDLGARKSYVEHEMKGFSLYLDTTNIQSYDKERILKALEDASEKLKDRIIV